MATMTTSNMKKASNVLGKRCIETEKNMKRKMQKAGVEEYKTVKARPSTCRSSCTRSCSIPARSNTTARQEGEYG